MTAGKSGRGGPRTGRPPKSPEEKQGETVFVRFTRPEREALEAAADGLPLATYLRRLVLRHLAAARRARARNP
jgi:hypothetical protein